MIDGGEFVAWSHRISIPEGINAVGMRRITWPQMGSFLLKSKWSRPTWRKQHVTNRGGDLRIGTMVAEGAQTTRHIKDFGGGVPELTQPVHRAEPFKGSPRRNSSANRPCGKGFREMP